MIIFKISTVSLYDLFKISTHNRCWSLLNSLISSPLNMDVANPFEFFGNDTIISVSILLLVAGSILTVLGEEKMKTFFSSVLVSLRLLEPA